MSRDDDSTPEQLQLPLFELPSQRSPVARAVTEAAEELPRLAQEMIEVMGAEATMALIAEMGGRRLTVPGWPLQRPSSRFQALENIVGGQAARAFAERWGNIEVQVPMAARAVRRMRIRGVIDAYGKGTKVPDLAARYKVTESTVWKWLKTSV